MGNGQRRARCGGCGDGCATAVRLIATHVDYCTSMLRAANGALADAGLVP